MEKPEYFAKCFFHSLLLIYTYSILSYYFIGHKTEIQIYVYIFIFSIINDIMVNYTIDILYIFVLSNIMCIY